MNIKRLTVGKVLLSFLLVFSMFFTSIGPAYAITDSSQTSGTTEGSNESTIIASAVPGQAVGSTRITISSQPGAGNTFYTRVYSAEEYSNLSLPTVGTKLGWDGQREQYNEQHDIGYVHAETYPYVVIYELNNDDELVRYQVLMLESSTINNILTSEANFAYNKEVNTNINPAGQQYYPGNDLSNITDGIPFDWNNNDYIWVGTQQGSSLPYSFDIDLSEKKEISEVVFYSPNGYATNYKIQIKKDNTREWEDIESHLVSGDGQFMKFDMVKYSGMAIFNEQRFELTNPIEASHVRLVINSYYGGDPRVNEIAVYNKSVSGEPTPEIPEEDNQDSNTGNPPDENTNSCASGVGDGLTEENPIIICTAEDLDNIRNGLDKNYKLGQDIDLEDYLSAEGQGYNEGKGWESIGTIEEVFTGTFDGNNYEIKNLNINRPDERHIGLFGFVYDTNWEEQRDESFDFDYKTQKIMFKNVKLRNVDINGNEDVGALAGFISKGRIYNSSVTGVIKGIYTTGGLLGINRYGWVSRSWSDAEVIGRACTVTDDHFYDLCGNTGGLVGHNDGLISESFSLGNVKGISRVGGLVGSSANRPIKDSYTAGKVSILAENGSGGGIAGKIGSGTKIINSFSIAEVNLATDGNPELVGGLVGGTIGGRTEEEIISARDMISSYWDVTISKKAAREIEYGTPISQSADMKKKSTYENWDFEEIWFLDCNESSDYPVLRWTMSEPPVEESCVGSGTETPSNPPTDEDNGGEGGNPNVPGTPGTNPPATGGNGGGASTGNTTEIITVDVDGDSGENLNKTPILRTTETNGTVKDFVTMPDNIARDTVKKAKEFGDNTARIMIPDEKDMVSETKVEVPKTALAELKSGDLNLGIYTENATIHIPKSSLLDFNDDLYFRLVPIKKEEERQQVEERAKKEEVVKEALGDGTIEVVGRPMTIETNLTSRKVELILPLLGVTLPKDQKDLEKFLNNLGIFIEHSDGDRVLVRPEPVEYKDGLQGLKFTIEKFSTFTIVKMDNLDEYFNGKNRHVPYVHGTGNGYFASNANVTRAQMAAMLARNLDKAPTTNLPAYKDVSSKHWAYADIMEAKNAGIMLGVSSTKFDPEGSVTRSQMAAIAYRWIQEECKKDSSAFESCGKLSSSYKNNYKDVPANHWAVDAINFLKATDIMVGYDDGDFHPVDKLTRAQAVKVLNRLFKRGPLTGVATPTFKDVPTTHWAYDEIEEAAREHSFTVGADGKEVLKH